VVAARERQRARLARWSLRCNAEMTSSVLRATCPLDATCEHTLAELVERRRAVTARSIDRLIKVARTIADLTEQDAIDSGALLEAAAFRPITVAESPS
jgi:magnesium chelatase family protein